MKLDTKTAVRLGVCVRCETRALLAKRRDGAGMRALYWCRACARPAFAGDSFTRVTPEILERLDEVSNDDVPQGALL